MKPWEVMRWAFNQTQAKGPAKLVLLDLAYHYNEREQAAWPGLARIRLETGLKIHTIVAALERLQSLGLVEKAMREGAHGVNRYSLNLPSEPDVDLRVSRIAGNGTSSRKVGLPVLDVGLPETAVVGLPETAHKPQSEPSKNQKKRCPFKKRSTKSSGGNGNEIDPSTRAAFERFYQAFPKRVGKEEALEAWLEVNPSLEASAVIIEGAERYSRHVRDEGTSWRYILAPKNWLKQKRWTDEYIQSQGFDGPQQQDRPEGELWRART